MNALLSLPIALPLLAAGASVLVGRSRAAQRVVAVSTLAALVVISVALLARVDRDGIAVTQAGGWPAPYGITLVADRLSAIMLVVSTATLLAVSLYAIGQGGVERDRVGFHPVYLVLAAGVCTSFLTGDLFTLFVAFEMLLVSSYVLITMGGRPDQIRAGMTYVVINLLASTLLVTTVAFAYAATGTVNMADLSERIGDLPDGLRSGLAVLMFVVFGIKAALFPLFFWLPDSYPTAPGPITAIFAGLLTKVGVYAILRTQTLLVPESSRPVTLMLVVAALTMAIGVLGALAQDDVKRLLSFHIVSQIGYMIFGLALFTVAGVAGAVYYVVHNIVVKTALLLVAGLVDRRGGSTRLSEIGGLVRSAPVLAVLFALPALSLAGIPPLSGFLGKFSLVQAGVDAREWAVVAVALAVSLMTLYSMTKVWSGAFWGEPEEEPVRAPVPAGAGGGPALMVVATGALVAMSLGLFLAGGPLYAIAERSATDLLDPSGYIRAVLGGGAP